MSSRRRRPDPGKTAAYLSDDIRPYPQPASDQPPRHPRARSIVAPTRELAVQISNDAESLADHTDLRTHVVFGGIDYRKQRDILGRRHRSLDRHPRATDRLPQTARVLASQDRDAW